mgnify:CR=1 FL=1
MGVILDTGDDPKLHAQVTSLRQSVSRLRQRLIVDEILPIDEIGAQDIRDFEEMADEHKKRMAEAAARRSNNGSPT